MGDENIKRFSNSMSRVEIHSINNYARKCKIYNSDKKELIKEFPTIQQAAIYLNVHTKTLAYRLEKKKKWFCEKHQANITVR